MPIGNPVTLTSNVASKAISVTATASQTLFNVTGGYRINELGVFKNGLRLQDGVDYTARDGLTVTLLSAASGGDKLQFVVFDTFRVAEAIRPNVDEQTIRGNLNVVGILSASTLEGLSNFNLTSGITTFNDVRVGGALTVAGVLTFDDVTNVDSVGYATFRSGINVQGAGSTTTTLNVTGVSTFGGIVSIGDSIFHTGDTNSAFGFPAADTFTVYTAGSERIRIDSSGNATLGDVTYGSSLGQLRIINDASSSPASLALFGHNNTTTGDPFGQIQFAEQESGTGGQIKAKIEAQAVSTNERGSDLVFFTAADSASSVATERLRIDSSGRTLLGATSSAGTARLLQIAGTSSESGLSATRYIDDAGGAGAIDLAKSRNGTVGSQTIVQSGDTLGYFQFRGSDGTNQLVATNIKGEVDGTPGTDDMPGRLVFATTADGASSPTERARIDSSGRVLISGQAALTSTSQSHTLQVAAQSDANAIAIHGRAADDIGELSFYEADKSTLLGQIQYRRDHVNFRHRVGEIRFATAGTTDRMIINSSGDVNITGITTASQLFEGTTRVATAGKAVAMALVFG